MAAALCFLFFFSGSAALVFENLWFHQASLAFGNSIWASSLVLAAFMAGIALGNAAAARVGPRLQNPVASYAGLEVVIGASGLALVWGLPLLGPALAPLLEPIVDVPWLLRWVRLFVPFLLLLIPASAMGATLPLLVRVLHATDPHFGRVLGRLYGWNTLGAVTGAVAGEAFLIESFGIRGTGLFAAGLNATAALIAAGLARKRGISLGAEVATRPVVPLDTEARRILAAVALSGFALLGLEVIWFRFLQLFVAGTSLTFALMLAVVLAGIALGGLVAGAWLRRAPDAARHLTAVAWSAGVLSVVAYAGFVSARRLVSPHYVSDWQDIVLLGGWLMFPVCFVSGVFFTMAGTRLQQRLGGAIRSTGLLTLANTVGAAIGPLVAGFVLLPRLGMERSLWLLSALYVGTGLLVWQRAAGSRSPDWARWATAIGLLVALVAFPSGRMEDRTLKRVSAGLLGPGARIVAVREGLTETIQYAQIDLLGEPYTHTLITNGYSMADSSETAQRYMKLYVYWPLAVHPAPRNALLVSYGTGQTAKALTRVRTLETIDIVDISEDVIELNDVVFPDAAERPTADPRVRVHIEDGRQFLQTTKRRFDLITGEPPPPRIAGVVNLYTREYFELIRERLAPGGMTTYWLPVRALSEWDTRVIIRAFCEAFEDCSLWLGGSVDWMLIGTRGAEGPLSASHFRRPWNDPEIREDLEAIALEQPEQLGALFLADADQLADWTRDFPPLTDDRPKRLRRRSSEDRPGLRALHHEWMDPEQARRRFESSDLIRRLWPPELRAASLPYFDVQRVINRALLPRGFGKEPVLPVLHEVLEETSLTTLPLWLMRSGARAQRIAEQAFAKGQRGPALDHLLGVGALAERRFAAADRHFVRIPKRGSEGSSTGRLRAYTRCRLGRSDEVVEMAGRFRRREDLGARARAEWAWLVRHCASLPVVPD